MILYAGVMGYGAAEATGLGFVCFIVVNPCVLSANRVGLGLFCFIDFPILLPPPPSPLHQYSSQFPSFTFSLARNGVKYKECCSYSLRRLEMLIF